MIKKGKIVEINGKNIQIDMIKDDSVSCGSCRLLAICNYRAHVLKLKSDKNLKVGDMVQFELSEKRSIFFKFLLFVIPLPLMAVIFIGLLKTFATPPSIMFSLAVGIGYVTTILVIEDWVLKRTEVQVIKGDDDDK